MDWKTMLAYIRDRLTRSCSRGMSTLWPRIAFFEIRSTAVYV